MSALDCGETAIMDAAMDPMVHLEHTSSQSACYHSENEVAELVGKLCVAQEDGRFISNSGEVIVNT